MRLCSFLLMLSTLSIAEMTCAEEVELAYFILTNSPIQQENL